ncbi:MAG TPA: LacI family transcriptional regulator [Ktedonobacter sp.]|nr:LacI family transcriptional regulator [Ktedonobacter sp.]
MVTTLKDVARHAGVSVKTVSNVVNGWGRMSEETRERVQAAIAELHYQPNLPARYLRRPTVGVIALAIPEFNGYFADMGNEIIEAASALGYTVLLDPTRGEHTNELLVINGLRPHLIDGLIFNPMTLNHDDLAEHARVPIVLLGERLLDAPYDHVLIDNIDAAYQATQHLIQTGCRRIAAIGLKTKEMATGGTSQLRLQGYKQALTEAGISIDEHLLRTVYEYNRMQGAQAMRDLLALPEPPDGVFCFNDLLALGVLYVLDEANMRVPDDIAVVGFDDIEECQYARPPLTTIAPTKKQIARIAVELLVGRIKGTRNGSTEKVMLPFELKVRKSTYV